MTTRVIITHDGPADKSLQVSGTINGILFVDETIEGHIYGEGVTIKERESNDEQISDE